MSMEKMCANTQPNNWDRSSPFWHKGALRSQRAVTATFPSCSSSHKLSNMSSVVAYLLPLQNNVRWSIHRAERRIPYRTHQSLESCTAEVPENKTKPCSREPFQPSHNFLCLGKFQVCAICLAFLPQGCQWLWSMRRRQTNKENIPPTTKSSAAWTLSVTDIFLLPFGEATWPNSNQVTSPADTLTAVNAAS